MPSHWACRGSSSARNVHNAGPSFPHAVLPSGAHHGAERLPALARVPQYRDRTTARMDTSYLSFKFAAVPGQNYVEWFVHRAGAGKRREATHQSVGHRTRGISNVTVRIHLNRGEDKSLAGVICVRFTVFQEERTVIHHTTVNA